MNDLDPRSFKTVPFGHQASELITHGRTKRRALFWEQGTGKTKAGIDAMAQGWRDERINGGVIVAPSGVERNWVTDELPLHMAEDVCYRAFAYRSASASTKWHEETVKKLLATEGQLPILALSYDAWMTDAGKQAVWDMMRTRKAFLHIDEAHNCKTPSSDRTKSVVKSALYAEMVRTYTGTPIEKPLDIYSQVLIVDPEFWSRELRLDSYFDFKHFFGIWVKNKRRPTPEQEARGEDGREFPILVSYQNLGVMRELLKKISTRVLKDDVLDLPQKLYTRRYYEMSPLQREIYDKLENEFMAEMPDDPMALITAPLTIVRMTRLQQVLCGYVPVDGEGEPRELIDRKNNPRADATVEFVSEAGNTQTIVWAQYRMDIDILMDRLKAEGRKPVRYDGKVNENEREQAKQAFKKGDASDFVGNPAVGAEGLTLTEAHTVAFHNNAYRMIKRKQAEDRAHRIGQKNAVLYGDMICTGTRDERAIEILQTNHKLSQDVLGDVPKEWL